ncbi:MAG: hypothetical protein ACE5NN_00305 [Candidatus Bathyarchaeia archaeon]
MKKDGTLTIGVRVPKELYAELAIRIPEGERSNFIREAIIEKLERTPRPDKVLELEQRIERIENDLSEIKRSLSDLEILTYWKDKVNPHAFCIDEIDHKIVTYLVHYKCATTPELADAIGVNRWLILNRLKRIRRLSQRQLGRSIITYYAGKRQGKRKAWWLVEDLAEV